MLKNHGVIVMTKENVLWPKFKETVLHYSKNSHVDRIENAVSFGMPDIYCCVDKQPFWVELKYEEDDCIKLRSTQLVWMFHELKAGGHVFILTINSKKIVQVYDATSIIHNRVNSQSFANAKMSLRINLGNDIPIETIYFSNSKEWLNLLNSILIYLQ